MYNEIRHVSTTTSGEQNQHAQFHEGREARLSTLTPRAHEALIKFRVGDNLDVSAKGGEMPEQQWLVVRNRLAVFANLQDDGSFTLAGVPPEVVDGWWTHTWWWMVDGGHIHWR